MTRIFTAFTLAALLSTVPHTSFAGNSTVENALKSRPDLSTFYQALVTTGVVNELQEGKAYTVFAPTNEAFARISKEQYPCFYAERCKAEVANILRSHIVPGQQYVEDISGRKGGVYAINHRFVAIGEPYRNDYSADGHNITNTNMLAGSMLYKIDGVIANPREMAKLAFPHYVEEQTTVTTQSVNNSGCTELVDCPEGASVTKTITKTTYAPAR